MKKITLLLVLLTTYLSNAQEDNTTKVGFVSSFQFTFGFANLAPNKSMMGEAHESAFPLVTGRLGVFHYNKLSLGLNASVHSMDVKKTQYYGYFDYTQAITIGPYISYYQPLSKKSLIEPYVSYDYVNYYSNYNDKKLHSESDGLGLGIDYQYKIGGMPYITFGLKYSINKMRTETNPNWEKYMNNYNFMSAKIGFTFSKNRL